MVPDIRGALAAEKERDLRRSAERRRVLAQAAPRPPTVTLRERLGRRLISLGIRLAADRAPSEQLFATPR
ncbi:hypothetical protein BH18ACT15_BH18ACT15_10260 [soil metagenome]